ncbi:hypothetical protein ACLQ8Z_21735 [Bordetella hinzii]|uniref:N-acetyltransferase YedL n=1 Tax=Bordetella hinzii OH87 BAL007II TaxID=1331262 RepID=A0ABR4QV80_9BORD|nr:hypothetical protein [Bordetella hinzii]KCB21505.1 hypothetical protein L544_1392 [Bordetella hinzii OH87 BAL007II]KCB43676.1 hypothetical protein L539_1683 [Bordetella hinzii 5132]QDJ43699.1 hypothetical protein CBR70_21685 [Bordetella hinzii]QDJ48281.1 hypothetical protein CBR71_22020 [Bordetella hinzii]QDJ57158.1 hypothetical protein CBR72_21240 [Bordetella hinzii]
MHIVIPGALPDLAVASELARHLPEHAPVFSRWLALGRARPAAFDPRSQGCTAYEGWQLRAAGFLPDPGLPLGAGLGPLLAGARTGDEAVWLGELVHLALGTDSATLLDPGLMDLRPEESAALFEAIEPLLADGEFGIQAISPQRWRLRLPPGLSPRPASPLAVAGDRLQHWWTQDATSRPWRRLLNEIQMAWYEHPVNEARAARGAPPVNGLWLYGGARPWTPVPHDAQVYPELEALARAGDWGGWLRALSVLDSERLKPLADAGGQALRPLELTLLGRDRSVGLTLQPRPGLLKWLPVRKHNWNAWWSHPV